MLTAVLLPQPAKYNKLEKADILEMTVRHVKSLHGHQQQAPSPPITIHRTPSVEPPTKYSAGFEQCATEVSRFLEEDETLSSIQRSRILIHLAEVMTTLRNAEGNINNKTPNANTDTHHHHQQRQQYITKQQQLSPILPRPHHHLHPQKQSPPPPTQQYQSHPYQQQQQGGYDPLLVHGVSLLPARLLTGQMALVLPHGVTGTMGGPGDLHHAPPSPPPSAASPSLSLSSTPPSSPCRSPSPQPLDLAPIRHPEDDNCWRPW